MPPAEIEVFHDYMQPSVSDGRVKTCAGLRSSSTSTLQFQVLRYELSLYEPQLSSFTHTHSRQSGKALRLRAAAGAAAAAAAVATAVASHDAAAEAATGGVAEVDEASQGVGGMDGAAGRRGFPPHTWVRLPGF